MKDRLTSSTEGRGQRFGWLLLLVFALFILWSVYTASQLQVPRSSLTGMPEMTQPTSESPQATMSDSMPGMDH